MTGIRTRTTARLLVLVSAIVASAAIASADDYIALINSGQVEPNTGSNGLGVFTATYDKTTNMLHFELTFTGLEGEEIAAHIHGPAEKGENASVLFGFVNPGPYELGSPKVGFVGPFTEEERDLLNRGLLYVNIHSSTARGGEIRGQIYRVQRR